MSIKTGEKKAITKANPMQHHKKPGNHAKHKGQSRAAPKRPPSPTKTPALDRSTHWWKILQFVLTAAIGTEMWLVYKASTHINAASAYILSSCPTKTAIMAAHLVLLAGVLATCYFPLSLRPGTPGPRPRKAPDRHKADKKRTKSKSGS